MAKTEDISSDMHEVSQSIDLECVHSLAETICSPTQSLCTCDETISPDCLHTHTCIVHPLHNSNKIRINDVQSRFKIVNILSNEPFRRGRWTCSDFKDPLPCEQKSYDSGNASVPSSIYFIPGPDNQLNNRYSAAIVYANGHPVLEPNPLTSQNENIYFSLQTPSQSLATNSVRSQNDASSCRSNSEDKQLVASTQNCALNTGKVTKVSHTSPKLQSDSGHSETLDIGTSKTASINVYSTTGCADAVINNLTDNVSNVEVTSSIFVETTELVPDLLTAVSSDNVDESGTSTFAIDNKIEQAMDLVKSHLMFAVHEEVELLKEQIKELTVKNTQLEIENNILRATATPETLAKLDRSVASLTDTTE